MYGMRGAYANGNVFAAGFVKFTIDPYVTTITGITGVHEFSLSGPYSVSDATGANAVTKTTKLEPLRMLGVPLVSTMWE
jgi:hypothetical protein